MIVTVVQKNQNITAISKARCHVGNSILLLNKSSAITYNTFSAA